MIREKPIRNRSRALAHDASRSRAVRRLLKMTDLLKPGEELADPVRVGEQIVVPVIHNRTQRLRYKDVVKMLAAKWLREENHN